MLCDHSQKILCKFLCVKDFRGVGQVAFFVEEQFALVTFHMDVFAVFKEVQDWLSKKLTDFLFLLTAQEILFRKARVIGKVTTALFVLIVLNTLWDQRQVLLDNLPTLGPAVVLLNVLILGGAYALSQMTGLTRRDRIAVITECGLKNSALGIVASLHWLHKPAMGAPSVVYALSMNAFALTFVVLMRKTVKW